MAFKIFGGRFMDEESCGRWIKFAAALLLASSLLTGCRKEWGSTTGIGGATASAAEAQAQASDHT